MIAVAAVVVKHITPILCCCCW